MTKQDLIRIPLDVFLGYFAETNHTLPDLNHLVCSEAEFIGDGIRHPIDSKSLYTGDNFELHYCDAGFYLYAVRRLDLAREWTTADVWHVDLWHSTDSYGLYLRDVERLIVHYKAIASRQAL